MLPPNIDTLKTLETLEKVYGELNAIRARDGAPQHIDWYQGRPLQNRSCTEEYWDFLTNELSTLINNIRVRL